MTKTRITKKLVAFATTMMLLAVMVIPAVAAPQGRITVHKYEGASMLGAVANTTGEQLIGADLAAITAAGYTPLADAEFTLYQLPQSEIDTLIAAITDTNGVEGHVIDIVGGFPKVTFTMEDGTDHVATATAAYGAPQVTDAAGFATFGSNIPDGYYVLLETDTPAGYTPASPSLIRLPLTKADGTPNYNVHVYPKNISTTGVAVKTVNGADRPVAPGDIVNFELKGKFISSTVSSAADLEDGGVYGTAEIQDNFDITFQYVTGSLSVHWLDASGNITGAALPATYYDVDDQTGGLPGGDLIVSLSDAGIDEAINVSAPGFGLVLDAEYVGAPGLPPKNTMQSLMQAANGPITPPIIDEVYVPSLSITVDKRTSAAAGDGPLGGVTFAVAKVPVPTMQYVPGTPAAAFDLTELATLAAEYVVDETGVPISGVTDAAGELVFAGLPGYNNAAMSFYLKELETKAGYVLLTETVEVQFDSKAGYMFSNPGWFNGTDWRENVVINGSAMIRNYELDEVNLGAPGFSLPLTGGAGTLLFTAIGIVVMLGAAGAYVYGKKKNS